MISGGGGGHVFKKIFLFPLCLIGGIGVVPCGGRKTTPRTSSIVQILFSVWSFEISEGIQRNQNIIIGLDSFSNQRFRYLVPFGFDISLCIDYPVERCKMTVILIGSMLPNL